MDSVNFYVGDCLHSEKRPEDGHHRPSKSEVCSPNKPEVPGNSNATAVKTPAAETCFQGASTPHNDDVTVADDVDGDVIDARKRHGSTSLPTDVIEDDDADDENDDGDDDGKKRKKTRTVFSRHQVTTSC